MIYIKKEKFVQELKNIKFIAHRLGYQMTPYPENSLEALNYVFAHEKLLNSCYGFEFDICFTKDHIPVVIHDKYLDDISDYQGLINKYNLADLKQLNFKPRKSINKHNNYITYKIITLEEILTFFSNHNELLKDKIIKIETKNIMLFKNKNLQEFAKILNHFPKLTSNLIHLSFWPQNLLFLKKIQKQNNYPIIKSDLLCDYNFMICLSKFMNNIDNISLHIKSFNQTKISKENSKRVNKKIILSTFFTKFANTLKEKNVKYALNKYKSVGLYTLNDHNEIDEICKKIKEKIFINNTSNIIITTNNPLYFKNLQIK